MLRTLIVVCILTSFASIGCGGGHAASDGGGGIGASGGNGGSGGTGVTDAGADHPCGAPAQTYTFATQRFATLSSERRAIAITLRANGTPILTYWGGPANQQQEVWATGLADGDDGGASVNVGYQLSRGPANGGIAYSPVVRATRAGAIRVAYSPYVNGNQAPRYVEWTGDFNDQPIDTAIDSRPLPVFLGFDLDPQDRPSIVYRVGTDVVLATNAGSGWQSETAWPVMGGDDSESLGRLKAALTFDGNGAPVLFALPASNDVYVASKGPQVWTSAFLDPKSSFGLGVVIGRDGLGQIEVMYEGVSGARRAVGGPGAWDVKASVPTTAGSSTAPAVMALGSAGEIHAVYAANPLVYAYYDGCTWSTQSIGGESGGVVGIALDAAGRPHIAYGKAGAAGEVWYAHPAP